MNYRPDMVADEEYGSPELDWVIIMTLELLTSEMNGHCLIKKYMTLHLKNMELI